MTFHVDSEVGQLKQVIVHRPGLELARLTPRTSTSCSSTTSCGPARTGGARRVRRRSSRARASWCTSSRSCSPRRSTNRALASSSQDELTTANRFGPALDKPLDELVGFDPGPRSSRTPDRRCAQVRHRRQLTNPSLLLDYLRADDFLLRPLPNHLFQRDNSAWVYDGLSVNPMPSRPASGRRSTRGWSRTSTRCSATPGSRSTTATTSSPRSRQHRRRRHHGHRQRRGDDRHG